MILPPRIAGTFAGLPDELVALCRPHSWEQLTAPPGEGMRSIRDILVHMMSTEAGWIRYAQHLPRERLAPEAFTSLDEILSRWKPQREATLAYLSGLSPDALAERRPMPRDSAQTATVSDVVWHVVTHDQYHRGQIFTRLALLGRRDLPDYDMLR